MTAEALESWLPAAIRQAMDSLNREFVRTMQPDERGDADVRQEGGDLVLFVRTTAGRELTRRIAVYSTGPIH